MKTREYLLIFKSSLVLDENAMKCSLSRSKINNIQVNDGKRMNSLHNLSISSTSRNDDEFRMNSLNNTAQLASFINKSNQR